jgi:hypothetical protein
MANYSQPLRSLAGKTRIEYTYVPARAMTTAQGWPSGAFWEIGPL